MVLRIGIIGAGVMGAGHARVIQASVAGAHLSAVYDADTARAQAAVADGVLLIVDGVATLPGRGEFLPKAAADSPSPAMA